MDDAMIEKKAEEGIKRALIDRRISISWEEFFILVKQVVYQLGPELTEETVYEAIMRGDFDKK